MVGEDAHDVLEGLALVQLDQPERVLLLAGVDELDAGQAAGDRFRPFIGVVGGGEGDGGGRVAVCHGGVRLLLPLVRPALPAPGRRIPPIQRR